MSCTDVQTIQAGNGTKVQFSFDFPYIFKSEIHVYFWNATTKEWDEKLTTDATYPWQITDANPTIVEFTGTAPPAPATPVDPNEQTVDNVQIRRITKIDDIRALFNPGSAIRSDDLNRNFEQVRYAIQEANCQGVTDDVDQYLRDYYWDRFDNTLYSTETWRSDDATIATTAAMDARFRDEVQDTLTKQELIDGGNVMPDNDDAVPTTGAVNTYINEVITNDIGADATGITVTDDGDGTITLGLAANSIDLDRIKNGDIVASGETWANDNDTIATTAAIDDIIDTAITNDIGVDATGLSVTDDGDGTITLGITAGGIDLDRINPADIITESEQDAGEAVSDDKVFTSSAAARRFDTLVQVATPAVGNYEVGKTWLQNDDDLTLSVWNGTGWTAISSGGTFREQTNVVYVDPTGDNASNGHRISNPKQTIKAAIEQINSEIELTLTGGGSGYVEGTYSNVPLTGGTSTGLLANITVNAGGIVSDVTVVNTSTLENYYIGDVLSADAADLGGSGAGLTLTVEGDGDGQIVIVAAGVYQEIAPIQIKRRNVSIIGQALRSCLVHPTTQTETNTLFELNSGSYINNLTITGVKAGSGTGNPLDPDLPGTQGWNFAFYNNAFITKSPYIQNCTNFSDSEINNANLNAHNPAGGAAGDIDSLPTGGGLLVNGATVKSNSPLRSMVCDSYTHVGLNGPGILVVNNGYVQATSSYAFFNKYHIKCRTGGQANLAASTTDFGEKALVADGKSSSAIFTADLSTNVTDGDITFTIGAPTPDASWHGTATRPQGNMLVDLDGTIYPVLSATANGSGWDVTISRPNVNNRSINDGVNGDVTTPQTVSFYLRSQIASSGHTMEYVGSGTDYRALPENGGVPVDANQITETNGGKIWTATTDQNGKFSVGDFFSVDQRTGFVDITAGSYSFDVVSDATPELGGELDALTNKIVNLGDPTAAQDAATKNYVDTQVGGIDELVEDPSPQLAADLDAQTFKVTNLGNPTAAQDAATKNYVDTEVGAIVTDLVSDTTPQLGGDLDVNGNSIVSVSNGDINLYPDGTGKVQVNSELTLSANRITGVGTPTAADDAATKSYVDTNFVADAGGTMSGDLAMGTNKITGLGDPTAAQDAATKNYVDTATAGISSDKITAGAGATEAQVEDTGAVAGHFRVKTEGFERFRIGPNGEIGIAGTSYGTAGQVLTSNGSGSSISWEDAASGATGAGGDAWAVEHDNTITTSYTITSGKNVISAGPMTINSGATVTVPSGSNWVIA